MAASGFDSRSGGPSSFAFNVGAPVQGQSQFNGATPNGQVVGGNSGGGVVRGSPITNGDDGDGIPAFLSSLAEPYIKAKQQEMFDKGQDDAAAGKALSEVTKSDTGISRIFGPTYYHQGAAMYAATTKVSQFQTDMQNDPDLYKQPLADRTKALSDGGQALLTGDPIADHLIQSQLIAGRPALVGLMEKKNYAYVQQQAVQNASASAASAGKLFASTATANAQLSASTDESNNTMAVASNSFLSSFVRPHGMSDESYQGFIEHTAQNYQASGNFYAYEQMKQSGLLAPGGILTDAQIDSVTKSEEGAAAKANGDAAYNPAVNKPYAVLQSDIAHGGVGVHNPDGSYSLHPLSLADIATRAAGINAIAAAVTGSKEHPLISASQIEEWQNSVSTADVAAHNRLQAHQWSIDDQQRTWQHDDEKAAAKLAADIQGANTAAATGNLSTALAIGAVSRENANLVIKEQINKGNFGVLAQNYGSGRYVNEYGANQIQSGIANTSMDTGPTKGFDQSYAMWQSIQKANPGAAAAYLGGHSANMTRYDSLIQAGEPKIAAFAQTFGTEDASLHGHIDYPVGVKEKDAVRAVDDAVRSSDFWALGLGGTRTPLSDGSAARARELLLGPAATYAKQSGLTMSGSAPITYNQALTNGTIERAGPMLWANVGSTTPLARMLKLPTDTTDSLFTAVTNKKLKDAGATDGAYGSHVAVWRYKDANEQPIFYIQSPKADGSGFVEALVTLHDLQAQNAAGTKATLLAAQPGPRTRYSIRTSAKDAAANAQFKDGAQGKEVLPIIAGAAGTAADVASLATLPGQAIAAAKWIGSHHTFHRNDTDK